MSTAGYDARIAAVVRENIQSLLRSKQENEAARGAQQKAADLLTRFSGSIVFVYIHVAWFVVWMLFNLGMGGLPKFDPFPFGLLTMVVSLEAIFLSTFVLISQNRSAQLADDRSDLDLQTNLLTEHEITRVLRLAKAIAEHLGLDIADDEEELSDLSRDTSPASIVGELERQRTKRGAAPPA